MLKIFKDLNIDYSDLNELDEESEKPAFLTDLNSLDEENKLDPVIGRSKEIRAVIEILG
jgi:ATP-dependent Clp protease ATP-binding subunit ClpB